MQFVVKVDRLGGKAEIRGIGLGDEKITRFEVTAKDYISGSALPFRIPMTESGEEDRSNLTAKLKELFISETRIKGELQNSAWKQNFKLLIMDYRSYVLIQDCNNPKAGAGSQ
jgi:hypothetical protein